MRLLSTLFFISFSFSGLIAQNPTFFSNFSYLSAGQRTKYGQVLQDSEGYTIVQGFGVSRLDLFGGKNSSSTSRGTLSTVITHAEEKQDYLLTITRVRQDTSGIYISQYTKDLSSNDPFYTIYLQDSLGSIYNIGPATLEVDQGKYLVFGNRFIYELGISNGEVNIISQKPNNVGVQTQAIERGGKVITCDHQGKIHQFDLEGNLLWSKGQGNVQYYDIKEYKSGFLLGGQKDENSFLEIIDQDGNSNEFQSYADSAIFDFVINDNDQIILTGVTNNKQGFIAKLGSLNDEIWRYSQPVQSHGVQIKKGTNQNYIVLLVTLTKNYLCSISEDGEVETTRFLINNIDEKALYVNNIGTRVGGETNLFQGDFSSGRFYYPKWTEMTMHASSGIQLKAKDEAGNLFYSVQNYRLPDFKFGLIDMEEGDMERIWSITKREIQFIKKDLEDGKKDFTWPKDIIEWPALGNSYINEDGKTISINKSAAPFVDFNNDGIYNTEDGDYPKIKGDQMVWWAVNDDTDRTTSFAYDEPLLVDVFISMYAYNCHPSNASSNTLFVDYEIVNRSGGNFEDFGAAFFTDPDLGCPEDDYIGCIPDRNSIFAYNITESDNEGNNCNSSGIDRIEGKIPSQSISFLDRTMERFLIFDDNEFYSNYPENAIYMHNYFNNLWYDNQPITQGGIGYNPGSTDTVKLVAPGNPANPNEWSLCSEDYGNLDGKGTGFLEPINLKKDSSYTFRVSLQVHPDVELPCPDINDLLVKQIDSILEYNNQGWLDYDLDLGKDTIVTNNQSITLAPSIPDGVTSIEWSNGSNSPSIDVTRSGVYSVKVVSSMGCTYQDDILVDIISSTSDRTKENEFYVHPNPVKNRLIVSGKNLDFDNFQIYDLSGKLVKSQEVEHVNTRTEINISDLPEGIFFLSIFKENQRLGTSKIVKINEN
ncbi:MAG: T9SS type A sorting domain-containing protein [Saprospiraceae bacterium]